MTKKRPKLRQLLDRIGKKAEIDTFASFLLQMNASGELAFKGCTSILECAENEICLSCSYGIVKMIGAQLNVPSYSSDETIVSGRIEELHFIWRN